MRVVLSGTSSFNLSNGLGKGFRNDPRVESFRNLSYGLSGTLALAEHIHRVNFGDFDYCVLDYCIREEDLIAQNTSSVANAMNNLCAVIDAASCAGCQPMILISATTAQLATSGPLRDAINAELIPRGIPVFDMYLFAQQMQAQTGLAPANLLPAQPLAKQRLGKAIAKALIDQMYATIRSPGRLFQSSLSYDPLHFVPYTMFGLAGHMQQVQRRSHGLKRDLLALQPGSRIAIATPTDGQITGLCLDAARCIGTLTTEDDNIIRLTRAVNSTFHKDEAMKLVFVPLDRAVSLRAGKSHVLCYDFSGTTTSPQPAPAMTLLGASVRLAQQARPAHILIREILPPPVHDWMTPRAMIDLAAALG